MKSFVRKNKVAVSVIVFLFIFYSIHLAKPLLLYTKDGAFREFGLGYRHKTILSIWIFSIILAIFSYLGVIYYLQNDF